MKVLHVMHGYFPESGGGSEAYVRDTIEEQQRHGMDVALLTGSMVPWATCGVEEVEVDGARVIRVHRDDHYFDVHAKAYHPGVERLLREILQRERPDLLHVHQWIRLTANLVEIADELGIPSVVTLHDLYTSCPRAFRVRVDDVACTRRLSVESCASCVPRYGHETEAEIAEGIRLHEAQYLSELSCARAVLVASEATAAMIAATTDCPRDRFTVLPLGYRRRFGGEPPAPRPLPEGDQPFRFGYWGNLAPRKGVHVLLEAFAQLVDAGPPRPVELHLYGGFATDAVKVQLEGLAGARPVRFLGPYGYDQLRESELHMAVFPMVCFETFGFVLDEAFELGLPCIVTDHGAMPRRAGDAALVVPPRDPAALAAVMSEVLARPALRDELRARNPGLPPTPREHAGRLARIYQAARTGPRLGNVLAVDSMRRAAFLITQRESAQRALHPGRGPE